MKNLKVKNKSNMVEKRIAIVGGGPSGIITLRSLLDEGFTSVTLFERKNKLGGCWNLTPPEQINFEQLSKKQWDVDPIPETIPTTVPHTTVQRFMDTATYPYLETNVEDIAMEFDKRFPKDTISKHGKDSPFRHFTEINQYLHDLADLKYVTFDTSVELIEKKNEQWRLVLRKFGHTQDYIYEEFFDNVVVASGHFDVPFVPEIPGLQQFSELDDTLVIHSKQFRSRDDFKDKQVVVVGASVSAMDSIRDILPVAKRAITSQKPTTEPHVYFGTEAFDHDGIEKRGQIVKIEDHTIHFHDGTSTFADAIILGTGFLYHYPFLPKFPELKELIFDANDPSLAFVGHNTPGLTFKLFQWQAILVARVFAGKGNVPTTIRNDPTIHPDFKQYYETLRDASCGALPEWNPAWEEAFYRGHLRRRQYWLDNP